MVRRVGPQPVPPFGPHGLCIITLVVVHRLVDNILISVVAGGVVLTAAAAPTIGISTIWVLLVYGLIGGTVVIVGKRAQV